MEAPKPRPSAKTQSPGLRDFDAGLRALKLGGPEANERAAESFARATAADPALWEAWQNLGVVRWRLGDDRGAVAAFGKALELAPDRVEARVARAEALRRLRKLGDARADYEAALKKDPSDNATRLRLASLLRESGDTDGSVKAVREVLRRNAQGKDLADANVELGLVYLAAGRMELAELVLSKAAQADPKNPRVWNGLGLLALKQGKDQEAFQRLDHATDLDPSFRDARFNKATVLLDAGDYAQARAELLAALKGQDDGADLDALVALGVAQRGLGDYKAARTTWERVLRVAPMQADALYDLGVLEMDFLKDEAQARAYLARYQAAAPDEHPRQRDAQQRMSELGPALPASQPTTRNAKRRRRKTRRAPRLAGFLIALFSAGTALAAPPKKPPPKQAKPQPAPATATASKEKTFDFAAMGIEGKVLAPQLLYLLGRIKVELDKGSLEGRSFMPELVRSIDEGDL